MEIQTTDLHAAKSITDQYEEALRYFRGQGTLTASLVQLSADLCAHEIDYAVTGAVALAVYGYKRFTENIDVILRPDGLRKFQLELLGRGGLGLCGYYHQISSAHNRFRSYPLAVNINVMLAGGYPGDGRPKSVGIPDPALDSAEIDGVRFVTLEKLVEIKLASGISAPYRLKDLADVQELIKVRPLQREFAERLDPYVREKFLELFDAVEQSKSD